MALKPQNKSLLKCSRGFASLETVWCSLLFALILVAFYNFFHIFYTTHMTLLRARNTALDFMWQPSPMTNSGITGRGIIYKDEYQYLLQQRASQNCTLCRKYTDYGDMQNYGDYYGSYQPTQHVFIFLEESQ